MKLKAPVEYWRKKKEQHKTARLWLGVVGLVCGVGLFVALGCYVKNYVHTVPGTIPWRELVGFFVVSSGVFWLLRIIVRLFLSSVHLAADAAEREVMAETYMALVRGDESHATYLEAKDRALVLAPLFRPTSTGIVTDDAAPAQIADLLAKIAQR